MIEKKEDVDVATTSYEAICGSCRLRWELYGQGNVNKGAIGQYSHYCDAALDAWLQATDELLSSVEHNVALGREVDQLGVGVIAEEPFSSRFAKAALESKVDWSGLWKRDRLKAFDAIVGVINEYGVFKEVADVFLAHGLTIRAKGAECHYLVFPRKHPELCGEVISTKPDRKIPCKPEVGFSIERIVPPSQTSPPMTARPTQPLP